MLISVLGFGSIWSRRIAGDPQNPGRFGGMDAAYYNTTGVLVGQKIRNRPRVFGIARFNGNSGLRPDCTYRMVYKVFDAEPPCVWDGHNKVFFRAILPRPEKPDAYLVTVTNEQTGGIDKDEAGEWLHPQAHLISFSECGHDQEVMVVMPAFGWLRGRLGAFFLEPVAQKPWEAHLMLSA